MKILPLIAVVALADCGHSSATRVWTLDALPPLTPPAITPAVAPIRVDVVHVPLALDRLEVVERTGVNRVTVHDFDRWSAPLGNMIRRTLTQDLVARLPQGSVLFPDAPKPAGTRALVVDILDLQRVDTGWLLDVSWTMEDAAHAAVTRRGQYRLVVLNGRADVAGQAKALSELVGQFADRLALALATTDTRR